MDKRVTITVTALPPISRGETDPLMRQFCSRVVEERSTITIDPPHALAQPGVMEFQAYLTQAATTLAASAANHGLRAGSATVSVVVGGAAPPDETTETRCVACGQNLTEETGVSETWDGGEADVTEWRCRDTASCSVREWTRGLPEDLHYLVRQKAAALPFLRVLQAEYNETLADMPEYAPDAEVVQNQYWHASWVLEVCLKRLKDARTSAERYLAERREHEAHSPAERQGGVS